MYNKCMEVGNFSIKLKVRLREKQKGKQFTEVNKLVSVKGKVIEKLKTKSVLMLHR